MTSQNPSNPDISIEKYRELKQTLKKYEADNNSQIILIPCSGNTGWYEIAERSALFYYYKVCLPLSLKVNFENDADSFYTPYDIGRIRIRNPAKVVERIKRVGLYEKSGTKSNCIIIFLRTKYTEEEIAHLKDAELARRSGNSRIINITFIDPTLFQALSEASTRLHKSCMSQLDRLSSQTNGQRIVSTIDGMLLKYYRMCHSKKNVFPSKTWRDLYDDTETLLFEIEILGETKLWNRDTCLSIGKIILRIQAKIEGRMNDAALREKHKKSTKNAAS